MSKNAGGTTLNQLTLFAGASPASQSQSQGSGRATRMKGGSGQSSTESFVSLSPDGCWLRMCQGYSQLTMDGSWEEYSGTWPRAGMMWSGTAYQQQQLVPHTSAIGYSLLPTPSGKPYGTNQGGGMGKTGPVRPSLETMARRSLWPTPTARDDRRGVTMPNGKRGQSLIGAARGQRWPTPAARDYRSGKGSKPRDGHALNLPEAVSNRYSDREYPPNETGVGTLNPNWVEWLMGFPVGWTDLEDSETP